MAEHDDDDDDGEGRGERTANALLASARTCFSELGYAGASVREIAGRAGVNAALVRYHFGSKLRLYKAVIMGVVGEMHTRLNSALADGTGDETERVTMMLEHYLDYVLENPDFPRLVMRSLLDGDDELIEPISSGMRTVFALFGERLELREAGLVSTHEIITTLFVSTVAPLLYAPMLSHARDEDVLSASSLSGRRAHLRSLVALMMQDVEFSPSRGDDSSN